MLEDYRRHADTSTPLLEEVDRKGEVYTAPIGCTVVDPPQVFVNCNLHGYRQAFNVPGLTSGQHICSECI